MKEFTYASNGSYRQTAFFAIAIGISQILIGATLTVVLMHSIHTYFLDVHIFLCAFGFHFFCAEAILGLNMVNGWSSQLRLRHRSYAHAILQLCGLTCVVTGSVTALTDKGVSSEAHRITGLMAIVLALLTMVVGPLALLDVPVSKLVHMGIGMTTFLMSSVSFILGLVKPKFKDWAGATVTNLLISFIVFYTLFIIAMTLIKFIMKILIQNDQEFD